MKCTYLGSVALILFEVKETIMAALSPLEGGPSNVQLAPDRADRVELRIQAITVFTAW